ncbi:MAG: LysR family transcriptional regulator [Rhodospirillales bacterium]|nr:LysR family transcriptional regulator [Rhodospirillales bacterium]
MPSELAPGVTHTRRVVVGRDRTIGFMGEEFRVYATPSIVNDMEYACRDFLVKFLSEGQDSVGARVEIDHLAPTLVGMWADIRLEIAAVEKRRVTFSFEVHDAVEVVGRGTHVRFIVDKPKTAERLAAKKTKAGSVPGAFPG